MNNHQLTAGKHHKESMGKLIPFMLRQAHHERNQQNTVRPETSRVGKKTCPPYPIKNNHAILHGKVTSQSGVVLVVSLIMLLLLTLLGITGMQSTSLEEKMAGNMRDKNLAFQAAESALNAAETSLNPPAVLPAFVDAGTGGFYLDTSTIPTASAILTDSFWTANPVATSSVTTLGNGIATPAYIIQKLPAACFGTCPPDPTSTPYRITVRATGGSSSTVVILQSIFSPS